MDSNNLEVIGPLHDPVTWYGINYAGTQVTQSDCENKGKSGCVLIFNSSYNLSSFSVLVRVESRLTLTSFLQPLYSGPNKSSVGLFLFKEPFSTTTPLIRPDFCDPFIGDRINGVPLYM